MPEHGLYVWLPLFSALLESLPIVSGYYRRMHKIVAKGRKMGRERMGGIFFLDTCLYGVDSLESSTKHTLTW